MNSVEFLAIRKLQKAHKASDYEMVQFLGLVNDNSDFEAQLEMAEIEVADESYRPEGTPPTTIQVGRMPEPDPVTFDDDGNVIPF